MKTKLTDKTFNPNLNEKLRYLKLNNFKGFSKLMISPFLDD